MNFIFGKKDKTELDKVLDDQIAKIHNQGSNPEEETMEIENLKKLADVKVQIEGPKQKINPNTILTAVVTVGTTLLMLNYEKLNNITSKALGFIPKPKM